MGDLPAGGEMAAVFASQRRVEDAIVPYAGRVTLVDAQGATRAMQTVPLKQQLGWQEVLAGSALASLLFAAGNFCIELYLGWVNIGSAYGAAGSLVVFVFWVYYSAQIYLFGAEVIKVKRRHSHQ